jgi:uncharacterized protein YndB with AHSA1/START domain
MAFDRSEEIEIDAPMERVFALVSDIRRHPEWAHNKLTVVHLDGPEIGEGAHYSSTVIGAMPGSRKATAGDIKIMGVQAPRLFIYECKDDAGTYRWTFHLYHRDDVCTVTHTIERLEAPGFVKVIQPMMWGLFGGNQVRDGLAKLKALAEQPVEQPAAIVPAPRQAPVELPAEKRARR